MLVLDDRHEARIARQSARRFRSYRGAVLDLAAPGGPFDQGLRIDVDDDLLSIAAVERLGAMRQEALRDDGQCIRLSHGTARRAIFGVARRALVGSQHRLRQRHLLHRALERLQDDGADFRRQLRAIASEPSRSQ